MKYQVGQKFKGCSLTNGVPNYDTVFQFTIKEAFPDGQYRFEYVFESGVGNDWKTDEATIDKYISGYKTRNSPLMQALS